MIRLTLELYFETEPDRIPTEQYAASLQTLVSSLAPHVHLLTPVFRADHVVRVCFHWGGVERNVPNVPTSASGTQSLLLTHEDIGAEGWAGPGQGCVSNERLAAKASGRGNPIDILIHEWIHTLEGVSINGRAVPNPDNNADCGFPDPSGIGADGVPTWHTWYQYCLGC